MDNRALFANKVAGNTRRALLVVQAVLLAAFLAFGVRYAPFTDPDSAMAVFVGMLRVAAMATQNALVRLDPAGFPSTAVLTTNTSEVLWKETSALTRSDVCAFCTFPVPTVENGSTDASC